MIMVARKKIYFPFLKIPSLEKVEYIRFHDSLDLQESTLEKIVNRIIVSSCTLEDIVQIAASDYLCKDKEVIRAQLIALYKKTEGHIGLIDLELDENYDMIVIEQGYGGTFVHTLELIKRLRKKWRILLVSQSDPFFASENHPDNITLNGLKHRLSSQLSYVSFVSIMRSIVSCIKCKLLFIAHRKMSFFLFDYVGCQPTVIYSDGFFDPLLAFVNKYILEPSKDVFKMILKDIFHTIHYSTKGISKEAIMVNNKLLLSGYFALVNSAENWCWGEKQHEILTNKINPKKKDSIKVVLPFTYPEIFLKDKVFRKQIVLYTTTMHNISLKGFPELLFAMNEISNMHVHCVVRRPDLLPEIPNNISKRINVSTLSRLEMIDIYHNIWVNCRVSREESSPFSILESMICEIPQIVSNYVADQIPFLENGVTGFVIDPDDKGALVLALKTILNNKELRDNMGKTCRERARKYSLDNRINLFSRYICNE